MGYFDLRLLIIVLIKMAKLGEISSDLITWTNLFCFPPILAAFSFVSIEVPLTLSTCSFRTLHIRLGFGNRPLSTAVSFMASLILPQPLFWCVYPAILLLSFCPSARDHALRSLQVVLPINKVYNIFIGTAAVEVMNEPHPQQDKSSSVTQDLEANIEVKVMNEPHPQQDESSSVTQDLEANIEVEVMNEPHPQQDESSSVTQDLEANIEVEVMNEPHPQQDESSSVTQDLEANIELCIIVLIKMAKSQRGGISWDMITWTNLFCFLFILAAFFFVSIKVPLTLSICLFRTLHIRLQFGNRPLFTAVSFMASLILSLPLFWYVYPAILLLSFYPPARDHALRSLQVVLPINKVYNIFIGTAAVEVTNEPHPQQDESSSVTQDLEANIEVKVMNEPHPQQDESSSVTQDLEANIEVE